MNVVWIRYLTLNIVVFFFVVHIFDSVISAATPPTLPKRVFNGVQLVHCELQIAYEQLLCTQHFLSPVMCAG
jgi:hypothetical protein